MKVFGVDSIAHLVEEEGYQFKLIANAVAVAFFPCTTEHHEATFPGLNYEDESGGNALAAMVNPRRIEFRRHDEFSNERVQLIGQSILAKRELAFLANHVITYQGRSVS